MLMFGPLSFQKNSRLNLKLHRLGSDHNLVGGELALVGGELGGGELVMGRNRYKSLETNGVCILKPSGEEITLRAILLCGTCDLPARCLVCNSIQFNGFYGCLRCRQPGKSVRTGKGGHVYVYPFNENDPCGPLRTKTGIMADAKQAVQQKFLVNGIKGPCWFAALQHHDIVLGTAIDYSTA